MDELVVFDLDIQEIQEAICRTSDEVTEKIDWTKAWGEKYPILTQYQSEVEVPYYAKELRRLLSDMEKKYGYCELDAFLVLKDILAVVWKNR
ncbi:hypothetical protein AALC25_12920 [Lachnospiraceae bacterium 29-84]